MTKPVNREHKKTGRKPKVAPEYIPASAVVEALAADGRTVIGIAGAFGTTKDVLRRWMSERPELAAAFERGRDRMEHAISNKLYRQAMAGVYPCGMFILKCQFGWREKREDFTGPTAEETRTILRQELIDMDESDGKKNRGVSD